MTDERRDPPVRVRVTGLQEAQLPMLAAIEQAIAAERQGRGLSLEATEPRTDRDIAQLTRRHEVRVLEADHEPAGYLAWRDEAPGVAVLEALCIDPSLQRYGLATRLLREVGDKAKDLGLSHAVLLVPDGDAGAATFLHKRGFAPAKDPSSSEGLPEPVARWLELRGGTPGGHGLWWGRTDGLGFIPGLPLPEPIW